MIDFDINILELLLRLSIVMNQSKFMKFLKPINLGINASI